jgi:protein gp37
MGDGTHIEWTDATWNPVTGCTKVSPGCDHCYAESIARRFAGTPAYPNGFDVTLRPERLDIPLRWKRPRRVFVNSMSDLFHADIPDEYIARVFAIMALASGHTFQVLTKRHARMRSLLSRPDFGDMMAEQGAPYVRSRYWDWDLVDLPLRNVWLGVSVETQQWADIRIPALLGTPAAVRFLSCEPLLGALDLSAWMPAGHARWQCSGCRRFYSGEHRETCHDCHRVGYWTGSHVGNGRPNGQPIDWVIVGGESGPGARPMAPAWAQTIRDQCVSAGVPFLFKQWGSWGPTRSVGAGRKTDREVCLPDSSIKQLSGWFQEGRWMKRMDKRKAGRELDGRTWDEYPERAS